MNDGLLALLDTEQGREMLENTGSMLAVIRRTLATRKQLAPVQEALLEEGWVSARESDPDVILFHPKAYGGPHFAEKLGCRPSRPWSRRCCCRPPSIRTSGFPA